MTRRLILIFLGFICGVFLQSCHGHKTGTYDPAQYQQVNRGDYAYKKVNDGEYVVAAVDHQSLQKALQEIGCDKGYVCLVEQDGEYFSVQQRKRQ